MKTILLIISGGVAAYKSVDIARNLKKNGCEVIPVITDGAKRFITPLLLQAATGHAVPPSLLQDAEGDGMDHIRLARGADLILVAPATANMLAKAAQGLADDLATCLLLSTETPVAFAPAMNVSMHEHPATQANIATLKARGNTFIGPASGKLACGEIGLGRLAEVDEIVQRSLEILGHSQELAGRKAVVTAGPTYEPIDPVRFIGNRSSGKQGYAIAHALKARGCDVCLITGPVHLSPPRGVDAVHVETAKEMLKAAKKSLPADIFIGCAAVGDWRVGNAAAEKLKKDDLSDLTLELDINADILKSIASDPEKRPRLVIGFCAETIGMEGEAARKRATKKADWMLGNDVNKFPFGGDLNAVHVVSESDNENWESQSKEQIAWRLTDKICAFFAAKPAPIKNRSP